jgi:hypothetical protein
MWYWSFFATRGYCSGSRPELKKRIRDYGAITYHFAFNTYTFTSFNWLHSMFYIPDLSGAGLFIKVVPRNIGDYLTPLALAVWFMDDGNKTSYGFKLCTNCFEYSEVQFLCSVLHDLYQLKCSVHSGGVNLGYVVYISADSVSRFTEIVKPHVLPCFYYK